MSAKDKSLDHEAAVKYVQKKVGHRVARPCGVVLDRRGYYVHLVSVSDELGGLTRFWVVMWINGDWNIV